MSAQQKHHASTSTWWDRLRTVPGLFRNIVVLVLLLVVGIGVSSYILTQTSFISPFTSRYTFSAEFQSAPATNPTSTHKVTIAGVVVGSIVGSHVTDRGTAVIDMNIEPGHPIFDNAHAVLRTINPLNEMYIEINPGGAPGRQLPENGVIPAGQTERPIQADEVMSHLDDRAQSGMNALLSESDVALARAPQQLPGGFRATDETLRHLQPAMAALQTRREKLAQLVTALSQVATAVGGNQDRAAHLANSTEQALGVLAQNDKDVRDTLAQLPGLNDQLRHALTSTQDLTKQLDPTLKDLDAASDKLPSALDRFTDTTKEIGRTVDAARPFVEKARPVVADLKPFISDVEPALKDTLPITDHLDTDTAVVTSYLTNIQAFIFNTSSVFSDTDARGPILRGDVVVSLPDGNTVPGQRGGYAPGPENGRDPSKDNRTLVPQGGHR